MIHLSSTNKTPSLELNSWIGSDIPSREDFNRDNSIIDRVISEHAEDTEAHTTAQEKAVWGSPYYLGTYMGNGSATRSVTLGCDFEPSWGIVFAVNTFTTISDFANQADYNYFALISKRGSTIGVSLSGKTLSVIQSGAPVSGSEFRNYNQSGTSYVYVVFR